MSAVMPNPEFLDTAHPHQVRAMRAFGQGCRRFYQAWHRRARKTTLWVNVLIAEAATNRDRVYAYVGPTYKQARSIIWDDPNMLFKWLPDPEQCPWVKNEQQLSIYFPGTNSTIRILGADDPDRLRGIDPWGVVYDEWSMMKGQTWTEIFRPVLATDPDRWAAFIFTPSGQNHAYEFHLAVEDDRFEDGGQWYVETLRASESGLIAKAELDRARDEMPTAVFDQEFEVSYITDEEMTLITSAMLENLRTIHRVQYQTKRLISCDPAMGGDACVILAMQNRKVVDKRVIHTREEGEIIGELLALGNTHATDDYVIDAIGVGDPIASRLRETGKNVIGFKSSERSSQPDRWRNQRDEAWWYAREEVRTGRVPYPEDMAIRREVSAVKFERFDATGKLKLQPKQKVKESLGHSPDHADAWIQGIFVDHRIETDEAKDKAKIDRGRRPRRQPAIGGWAS